MTRLTDNDRKFGSITYARAGWKNHSIKWCSGGGMDEAPGNYLMLYLFGWVIHIPVFNLVSPYRGFIDRNGHSYWDEHEKEFGYSIHEGCLAIHYGAQTHDSSTSKRWSWFIPWTQWRFTRYAIYDKDLKLVYEWREGRNRTWEMESLAKSVTDKASFEFTDFDGTVITAATIIEEREWKFGTGWFKWLSLFRRKKVRRSLEMSFSAELGPEKGSWKGGVVGMGMDMLPGEDHEAAFKRWCVEEKSDRRRKYHTAYVGRV